MCGAGDPGDLVLDGLQLVGAGEGPAGVETEGRGGSNALAGGLGAVTVVGRPKFTAGSRPRMLLLWLMRGSVSALPFESLSGSRLCA